MIKHPNNPIITPKMVKPSNAEFQVKGALNPGAAMVGEEIVLLLRIAEGCPSDRRTVRVPNYRFEGNQRISEFTTFDRRDPELRLKDSRAVVYKDREYVSTLSHLRLARSNNGVDFKVDESPFLLPQNPSEEFGVEDARITQIGNSYYINYTAVSRDSYGTALVRTDDFETYEYIGMIFAPPNKDVCIFPEKINGEYVALHRPYNHDFGKSSIWIASSPDLVHWGKHKCLLRPRSNKWESEKIGGGAPPIKTDKGWLEIYHGKTMRDGRDFYSLMVLLLDLEDPSKIIYQGEKPILLPTESYEINGFVPNVVFLNGMVMNKDSRLLLYYSSCDETTCLAQCSLNELLPSLP